MAWLYVVIPVGIRELEMTVERAGQFVTSGPQLVMVICWVLYRVSVIGPDGADVVAGLASEEEL